VIVADPRAGHDHHLEQPEGAREEPVGRQSLGHGERGVASQHQAEPEQRPRCHGEADVGVRRQRDERQPGHEASERPAERRCGAPQQHQHQRAGDQPAEPERGVEHADPGRPEIHEVDRDDDDQHVRQAVGERDRADQPERRSQATVAPHLARRGQRAADRAVLRRAPAARVRRDTGDHRHRQQIRAGARGGHGLRRRRGEQQAAEAGAGDEPGRVRRSEQRVAGRQAPRAARQRGEQRGARRLVRGRDDAVRDRERVDRERQAGGDGHRGGDEDRAAQQVRHEQHVAPRPLLSDKREERRQQHRRQRLGERDQADGLRAAVVERVDDQRDLEPPLAQGGEPGREGEAPHRARR